MKFQKDDRTKFGWEGVSAWPYSDKQDNASASAIYFEISGTRDKIRTTLSDRVYLVLDGEGEFTIDGTRESVAKDDVIIVPKNTLYGYKATKGTLKLYLVHVPAYDPNFEEDFNEKS